MRYIRGILFYHLEKGVGAARTAREVVEFFKQALTYS